MSGGLRAAWICALVAVCNAACWSILTYAFQAPDEPDHYAYVKQLAETASLPSNGLEQLSGEEELALEGLRYRDVRELPEDPAITSSPEARELHRDLRLAAQEHDTGSASAGVAQSEPPLYYAIEAIPYTLASGDSMLGRLQLMRLTSALLAGVTAMFVFLFAREALPGGPPRVWCAAGLAVALVPLLGFMSGAVNPDALLYAVSAAVFYFLARAFRRGFDRRGALTIGALVAVGLLTKLNFIGLVPGVFLGLVVLTVRAARARGRTAYRLLALALGVALSPVAAYAAVNALSDHPPFGIVSAAVQTLHGSVLSELNYIWQLYLPHIPGTVNDFPGISMLREVWFRGYVGLYGWFDTTFPGWVYTLALLPATAIAVLCARELLRERLALRRRAGELATYAAVAVGLLGLIGADSYHEFPMFDASYAQVRYLLPLLALFGAALALAVRGAGRRFGPVAGAALVVLFLAHDVFSQLLVVGRYYG
ncbi:MAG TPA: DUF2142 domain-containing protein [Solirubrobacteraceae bacterium]|nr:DUF2142 domain-containing protein [Solirubrobacteraceae bacterium]